MQIAAPVDSETVEKVDATLKFLSKAYNTYKDFDDAKDRQEEKFVENFDKIPLNRVLGTDPV